MHDTDIEKIIPHRDTMKLIDEIIESDDNSALTTTEAKETWPLVSDGKVNPVITIEIIAQTSGIAVGLKKIRETGKGAFGYLVGIKNADFPEGDIPVGSKLECKVNLTHDLESYAVFKGTVYSGNKIFGKAELQLFNPEK